MQGALTFQITPTKAYCAVNFLEDFKNVIINAGLKGLKVRLAIAFFAVLGKKYEVVGQTPAVMIVQVAFILSDCDIRDEIFLDYVNQFLATGRIPGMFARSDLENILNDLRPILAREDPGKKAACCV